MKFCTNCDSKLEMLKAPAWTSRFRCTHAECGRRYEVVYADGMGGANDDITTERRTPFKEEELYVNP